MEATSNFISTSDFAYLQESLEKANVTISIPANISLSAGERRHYRASSPIPFDFDYMSWEMSCSQISDFRGVNNYFSKFFNSGVQLLGYLRVFTYISGHNLVIDAVAVNPFQNTPTNLQNSALDFRVDAVLLKSPFAP